MSVPNPSISAPRSGLLTLSRRAALMGGVAALASGCASLESLQTATQAPDLYALSPKSSFDLDLPTIVAQVVVDEPTASAAVNTDRIAVRPHPLKVEYFPRVRWVDRAPLMIQNLMVESIENTGKVLGVGRRAGGLSGDYTLLTDLREFQAETEPVAKSDATLEAPDVPLTVHVRLNMKVVVEPAGLIAASDTFAFKILAASSDILDIAEAFDIALGKCIGRAVSWSLRVIADIEARPRPRR
ncbi:MAG: cholesterol transport system auxiliary component [Paracoccaceae bacterium]|jgi:cholesterol transport system auxiliary component